MKKLIALLASLTALSCCYASCLPIAEQIKPMHSIVANAEEVVASGTCGENLTWNFEESTGTLTISGTGAMEDFIYDDGSGRFPFWFTYFQSIENVVIEDGITTIGKGAFPLCDSLTSVTIPDSVTAIENEAFHGCKSLTSVTIENPECEIYDGEYTISDTATIYGYDNSTAQAYAETYNRNFVSLGTALEKPTTEILTGDANKDGEFNILDIITLQKWLLGSDDLPNWQAVDFNQDGMITIFDFVLAKKYYLKNI